MADETTEPRYFVRDDGDGLLIFHVTEETGYPEEAAEMAARGFRWYRCYSVLAPTGEGGHVHDSVLTEITPEQFEGARASGWETLPPASRGPSPERPL